MRDQLSVQSVRHKINQTGLDGWGYVKIMKDPNLQKHLLNKIEEGYRPRGRPQIWIDKVKMDVEARGYPWGKKLSDEK